MQRVDYVCPWCDTPRFAWMPNGAVIRREGVEKVCQKCRNAVLVWSGGVEKLAEQARF